MAKKQLEVIQVADYGQLGSVTITTLSRTDRATTCLA